MSLIPVLRLGARVLRTKATEVPCASDPLVQTLAENMRHTVQHGPTPGIGLAAPQVGHSMRMFLFEAPDARGEPEIKCALDPRITSHTRETDAEWEGCLSIPGLRALVERYSGVEVAYTTLKGDRVREELHGLPGVVFQHELDHLDGVCMVDRVRDTRHLVFEDELMHAIDAAGDDEAALAAVFSGQFFEGDAHE